MAFSNKGLALNKLGRNEEALQAYQKALELNPSNKDIQKAIERIKKRNSDLFSRLRGLFHKKGGQIRKRTSNSVFIISFLVLGASFLVLGTLTIMLWQAHLATGEQSLGLLAWLSGMLATAVLIG